MVNSFKNVIEFISSQDKGSYSACIDMMGPLRDLDYAIDRANKKYAQTKEDAVAENLVLKSHIKYLESYIKQNPDRIDVTWDCYLELRFFRRWFGFFRRFRKDRAKPYVFEAPPKPEPVWYSPLVTDAWSSYAVKDTERPVV